MTDPINDQTLVEFLKRNSPIIPEPAPNLEQQIMAAIEEKNWREKIHSSKSKISHRWWLVPPAIAASVLVFWSGSRLMTPTKPSPVEEERLEAFLINNWEGIVGENTTERSRDRELDWFSITNPNDNQKSTTN